MAYTTPVTQVTGDTWTRGEWNTYVKGNFEANPPHMITAAGDLVIATAANAVTRLGIGSTNQTLVSDSTQATGRKWANSGLVPVGGIVIWSGSVVSIPANWQACDGTNGTPDLRNKFIIASITNSGATYDVGDTGGAATIDIDHSHTLTSPSSSLGGHTHTNTDTGSVAHHHHLTGNTSAGVSGVGTSVAGASNTADHDHTHTFSDTASGDNTHSHTQPSTGTSGAHTHNIADTTSNSQLSGTQSILPPYYALCYIERMA
jgi:hypothetical protein